MKNCKKIVLALFFMNICFVLHSQNRVSYGYDSAGNRTSRTIILLRSAPASEDDEEEQPVEVYSELLSDIELKIYPNPTDGWLKVEIYHLPEGQTAHIWLYNLSGNLITSFKEVSDFENINLSGQPAGIYVMKIVAGEYQTEWRIIKK